MYAKLRRISFIRRMPNTDPTRLAWIVGTLIVLFVVLTSMALWRTGIGHS